MTKLLPCVISSLGGISYPKKKRKKRKEPKTTWKFEKKKNWNFFWENLVTKLVVI